MASKKKISGRPTYGTAKYDRFMRMESLINLKQMQAARVLLQNVGDELAADGFDDSDIKEFLLFYLGEDLLTFSAN